MIDLLARLLVNHYVVVSEVGVAGHQGHLAHPDMTLGPFQGVLFQVSLTAKLRKIPNYKQIFEVLRGVLNLESHRELGSAAGVRRVVGSAVIVVAGAIVGLLSQIGEWFSVKRLAHLRVLN